MSITAQKIDTKNDESILEASCTNGLGRLTFRHPHRTFALTPASMILLKAIADNKDLLHGTGLDWGSGVGCQAILAAKIDAVDMVYGLDISKDNVDAAVQNAKNNKVDRKTRFILADSYEPLDDTDRQDIRSLNYNVDFIVSNPPSSDWDDGFGYRRIILSGAQGFLKKKGIVLMNISFQYGADRVKALTDDFPRFKHVGVIASTDRVPFDLSRPDLLDCLEVYAREEKMGGMDYTFIKEGSDEEFINARTALTQFKKNGTSPLTKWQTHLFQYE